MFSQNLPQNLDSDINRFEQDLKDYTNGNLHETAFTAKRVKMGVYMERSYSTYMIRIRCTGNIITPVQLKKTAELALEYGDARVHVTTRAEIQIHGIDLENVLLILRTLASFGLTSKGGGGHTIRNIVTNPDSGINPAEVFDVQPHAVALTSFLISETDSFELPRKFKIAFSSTNHDPANCTLHDLGFVAQINENNEKGFRVYAGGGLGAKPKTGVLLHNFLLEEKIFHSAKAIKDVFHNHGNRKNKHKNRIKFLIHNDLGEKTFKQLYRKAFDKRIADKSLNFEINDINNEMNKALECDLSPYGDDIKGFNVWRRRYVLPQKQEGLFHIKLPLNLGDLTSQDCFKLVKILMPLGENSLRCGSDQNFYIRNIPEKYLKNIYHVVKEIQTLSLCPNLFGNVVPCTGAQTCLVGINYPRPATMAIFKQLKLKALDYDCLNDITIRISGCPNSCANHWIGDLAFYGKVRHVKGHPIPTYNVIGGACKTGGEIKLAEDVGWVHTHDLPRFLTAVLENYLECKPQHESNKNFQTYWDETGKTFISNLCETRYNSIPSFEEDKNYYFDHGAKTIFSVKDLGRAECSAGIYDMIDVDVKIIRKNIKIIEASATDNGNNKNALELIIFSASRMLLVTRGEDPRTDRETHALFLKHFVDTGLIGEDARALLELMRNGRPQNLADYYETIINLGKEVIELYKSMDNTMRFPGETQNPAINMESKIDDPQISAPSPKHSRERKKPKNEINKFIDLRGVKCPINYAKTKVQLSTMKSGEILEIYLDDGEPINNVPGSVQLEGHKILKQKNVGDYWDVVIEKV